MITARAFAGKSYAVLGLARSGAATARALLASGAEVLAWDEDEQKRKILPREGEGDHLKGGGGAPRVEPDRRSGQRPPVPLHHASHGPPPQTKLGEDLTVADLLQHDLTGYAGVIVSPGVPLNRHPIAAHAARHGVPVIGDIELFALARPELPPHKVVGITGTNGKSTTTALIHHILKTAGVPAAMGGNIGLPILAQDPLPAGGVYVLELSSFQIDLTRSLDCEVAVLLNITPDHLDRYSDFEGYAAAKARLFEMQSATHAAVIGIGTAASAAIARDLSKRGERLDKIAPGTCMDQSRWPALQGPHNAENALAAIAVCRRLGVPGSAIDKGLESFTGLPHRMEIVAQANGVLFINDSKATNQASAAPALAAYPPRGGVPRIHWIVGGQAKEPGLAELADWTGHVAIAYTIGEAGPAFAELLKPYVPVEPCGTLEAAVRKAAAAAKPGDVVLLSPACASFDQFRDFEERGEMFRRFVAEATGAASSAGTKGATAP